MPLLAKETYLFPPSLFGDGADADHCEPASDDPWWALYTTARNEKSLMRTLHARERRFYCPVVAKRHRVGRGCVRTSYLPLFSSYVFLQGDEQDRYEAVCTGLVSRCLPIVDRERFVQQMRSIQLMIEHGLPLELEPQLRVGAQVRVKSGPLKGLEGQILKARGRTRFIVNVEFLQQGASTVLDDWELEKV